MKNLITTVLLILPICIFAQNTDYKVSSYKDEGFKAPNTHYIGEAWLNGVLQADDETDF